MKLKDNTTFDAGGVKLTGIADGVSSTDAVALGQLGSYLTTSSAASTYQPLDADLSAIAAQSGTGLLTRTGSNTWTTRTLTGTTNVITVTGGDGVAGNPVITISPTYVGQTSITTLGTITSGTWNGTTIAVNHGGWGLATLTIHALYVGNGTSAPTALAVGTTGQVVIGNTGADPSWSGGPQLFPPASGGAQSLIGQPVSTDVGVFVNPAASITSGNRYYTLAAEATAAQVGGSSTGHVVAGYFATESNTAGAFIWAQNALVSVAASMTSGTAQGFELDVNNAGVASLTPASALKVYGYTASGATGAGWFRCISPFSVQGGLWNYGLTFYNDALSGGQAYVHSADATYPAYGINFSGASFGTAAIQLASGQWNGDGTRLGVGVNPTGFLEVQSSSSGTIELGTFRNSSSATTAIGQIAIQMGSDGGTSPARGLALGCQAKTSVGGAVSALTDYEASRVLIIQTTTAGSVTTRRFAFDTTGNVVMGTAAIATNATDGFFYLDSCAGTPTGTPTAYTGRVPLVYDTTHDQLHAYNGSWKPISGLTRIGQVTLGADTATITFSSIPGVFTDLVLSIMGRCDTSAGSDGVYMQFNGDTGTNYSRQYVLGTVTTVSTGADAGAAQVNIGGLAAASATAGAPGIIEAVIHNYAGTTFFKLANAHGGYRDGTNNFNLSTWFQWASTAAITSLLISPATAGKKFVTGTVATLYGRV